MSEEQREIYVVEEFAELPGYEKVKVSVPGTGGEGRFTPLDLGTLEIKEPGVYVLELRPVKGHWDRAHLRAK